MINRAEYLRLKSVREQTLTSVENKAVKLLEKYIDTQIMKSIDTFPYRIELPNSVIEKTLVGKSLKSLVIDKIKDMYSDYNFNYYSDQYDCDDSGYIITLK